MFLLAVDNQSIEDAAMSGVEDKIGTILICERLARIWGQAGAYQPGQPMTTLGAIPRIRGSPD
jgi:hypothetical protein